MKYSSQPANNLVYSSAENTKRAGREFFRSLRSLCFYAGIFHKYRPDYLIRLTKGTNLVVETKGQNTPQDDTKRRYLGEWVKAVNEHGGFGKWKSDRCLAPSDLQTVIHSALQEA